MLDPPEVQAFLEASLSPLTKVGVGFTTTLWHAFASEYVDGSPFLDNFTVGPGSGVLVSFVQHLLDRHELTPSAVRIHLTKLRSVFVIHCGNVTLFDSAILTAARKVLTGNHHSLDTLTIARPLPATRQLPFTVDMLHSMPLEY